MSTNNQASVPADAHIERAKSRFDPRALARLEARAGKMPQTISLEYFSTLVAQEQSRLIRRWQFQAFLVAWAGIMGLALYFHAFALVAATIPLGFIATRIIARKLVADGIRETIRGDA